MTSHQHALLLAAGRRAFLEDFARWELPQIIRATARQAGITCSMVEAKRIAQAV